MSARDWYAKKLGVGQPAPPAQRQSSTPPVYAQPGTNQQPQVALQQLPPANPNMKVDENNYMQAAMAWSGGVGVANAHQCPQCGSANGLYYSRVAGNTVMKSDGTVVAPAPQCFECGYSGAAHYYQDPNMPTAPGGDE